MSRTIRLTMNPTETVEVEENEYNDLKVAGLIADEPRKQPAQS